MQVFEPRGCRANDCQQASATSESHALKSVLDHRSIATLQFACYAVSRYRPGMEEWNVALGGKDVGCLSVKAV